MSSASVIIEDRGRVLLLLRGPNDAWMPLRWDLPGGSLEPGETARQAAAREVREETGLRVRSLVPVARSRGLAGTHDVLYAGHWSGQVQLLDGEHVSHAWVPRAEAPYWDVVPSLRETLRRLAGSRLW
jgi:8-oxo-dGTP diphosphatase